MPDEKSETAEKWLNEMKKEVMKVGLFLVENFYSLPRTIDIQEYRSLMQTVKL